MTRSHRDDVRHRKGGRVAAAGVAAVTAALAAVAPPASAKTIRCSLVSASKVNTELGTSVTAPKQQVVGPVTVCRYPQPPYANRVTIRYQTDKTAKTFAVTQKGFTQSGQPVVPLPGLGDQAFTSTIGTGSYVYNTVVVRKGLRELLITSPASLAQEEALAQQVLPSL